jgi:HemY protein
MKLLTVLLVVLLAVLGVGYWFNEPGYVLVRIGDVAAEATVWGSLVALLCVLVVLRLIYLTLRTFLRGSSWLIGWTGQRKANDRLVLAEKAALASARSDWPTAERLLLKAKKLGDIDFASNIGLARAAYELGNKEVQISALASAKVASPANARSISSIALTWLITQGESEEVIETLQPSFLAGECAGDMLVVLTKAYLGQGRWSDVQKLWPLLEKQKLLQKELFDGDFERLWAVRLLAESKPSGAMKVLPKAYKADVTILLPWIDLLLLEKGGDDAAEAIEHVLTTIWHEKIVQRYSKAQRSDVDIQLAQGKKWLKKRPNDVVLLMTLGRLSTTKRKLTLAREHFDSALTQAPKGSSLRKEIYRELGGVCHGLGDSQLALQYLLKA